MTGVTVLQMAYAMACLVARIGKPEFCGRLRQTAGTCLDFDNVIALATNISWQTVKVFREQLFTSQSEPFAPLFPLIGADENREKAEAIYV